MLLALGLPSGRAKFFGTCVVCLYFILVYMRIRRPIRPSRQLLTAIVVGGLVAAVGWNKFRFYFIDLGYDLRGGGGGIENLARPALYAAALLIMISRIPSAADSHRLPPMHRARSTTRRSTMNMVSTTSTDSRPRNPTSSATPTTPRSHSWDSLKRGAIHCLLDIRSRKAATHPTHTGTRQGAFRHRMDHHTVYADREHSQHHPRTATRSSKHDAPRHHLLRDSRHLRIAHLRKSVIKSIISSPTDNGNQHHH